MFTILYGIIWALWRRCLGGWLGLSRVLVNSVIPIFLLPVYLQCQHIIDIAIITGVTYAYWLSPVDFNQWWVSLRYPVSGLAYPILKKVWRDKWNIGTFIDGYTAVAELFIGFCFGCCIYFICCL